MKIIKTALALALLGTSSAALLDVQSASAAHKRHGTSVQHATQRANAHGGTAKAVAPDSKQSATGGQPGGLPGHQ